MEKKVVNWAAIHGRWRFEGEEARYQGPQAPDIGRPGNPFGISVSDSRFSEGVAKTNVRLPANGSTSRQISMDTSAYLTLGYRALDQEYFLVGLAGYDSAYTLSRYVPERGWVALATAGSRENLSPDTNYELIATACRMKAEFSTKSQKFAVSSIGEPSLINRSARSSGPRLPATVGRSACHRWMRRLTPA
jgi:hypothetical protein